MKLIPQSRNGSLWRAALAAVIVIAFTAAATAVAGLLKVADIAGSIITPSIQHPDTVLPQPGAPETLLLIGSDHRASDGANYTKANTDTMMLVRINDSSSTINLLSVPRDLRVHLAAPGCDGTFKLNAAYSCGGPNLLIKTMKAQVFPDLQVNHIIDINFSGFSDLIDAIGCVYTDVDHRYFNQSQPSPSPDNYSSIDIQPGYQKLCGDNQADSGALAFVRFRHTDTDIVRNARQQDFLRWAKDGYSTDQILANESKLVKILGAHTQTDHSLHTTDGLIDLADLVINADKLTLKSVPFPAQFTDCNPNGQTPCYVTATPAAMQAAYGHFIRPTTSSTASSPGSPKSRSREGSASGLVSDVNDARNQALDLGKLSIPVYYPKLMPTATNQWQPAYCSSDTGNCDNPAEPATAYAHSYPRRYEIRGSGGGVYASYRITVVLNSGLGEYYGIQGTAWQHPPILNAKSTTVNVDGKSLQVFKNGARVSLVAYHTPQGIYWVSNTLADALGNNQMIGIAASLTRAP